MSLLMVFTYPQFKTMRLNNNNAVMLEFLANLRVLNCYCYYMYKCFVETEGGAKPYS